MDGCGRVQLLQRHCDTAEALATELRAAAQRCESLRDNLWYLIDAKAATAIAVDDRTRAQRPEWLAAAAAVTAGQPDRDDAHNLIRQQVIPYVDNDIRNEWLPAMRSATDGVQTSYAMVVDRMAAAPAARFEFPGDLGSGLVPVPATAAVGCRAHAAGCRADVAGRRVRPRCCRNASRGRPTRGRPSGRRARRRRRDARG